MRGRLMQEVGTPGATEDWSDPDRWIPRLLDGQYRGVAEAVWRESEGQVNPRHTQGIWTMINHHELMSGSVLKPTDRGVDFLQNEGGRVEAEIDGGEGLLKLLSMVRMHGQAKKKELADEWHEYVLNRSDYRSRYVIITALGTRLANLYERDLLEKKGAAYTLTDRGRAYLSERLGDELGRVTQVVEEQRRLVREALRKDLQRMEWGAFEILVGRLLWEMGYEVEMVGHLTEGGADVVATIQMPLTTERVAVEVKHRSQTLQRSVVGVLRDCLSQHGAERGMIVTTSRFSTGAKKVAEERGKPPVRLVDGEEMIDLLIEYEIGVTARDVKVIEFDAEGLAEASTWSAEGEELEEDGQG